MRRVTPDLADSFYPPSTRYQGSKRKLLPWLHSHFENMDFVSVLDLFGGTGSVSYLLKRMGKKVTFNDALHFNYRIGRSLISNDRCQLGERQIEHICNPRTAKPSQTFITSTFEGIYFTQEENLWIDKAVAAIEAMETREDCTPFEQDLAYNALFQTCLSKRPYNLFHRANLYMREAEVKRRFGNKTTWEKPASVAFQQFASETNAKVFKGKYKCETTNLNALCFTKTDFDLVYIDAPYLSHRPTTESANYRRVYHFLEGLSDYKNWHNNVDYSSKTKRLTDQEKNPWLDNDCVGICYDVLFDQFASSMIAISIKKFGVPSVETISRKLQRHGRKVVRPSVHYKYALNRQNGDATRNREFLIISEK